LRLALSLKIVPAVLDILVGLAALLIKAGEWSQALKLLRVGLSHPASSRDNQDRAARLLAELEPQLPAGLAAKIETGDPATALETMVQEILA
jgi:hypothetical protein